MSIKLYPSTPADKVALFKEIQKTIDLSKQAYLYASINFDHVIMHESQKNGKQIVKAENMFWDQIVQYVQSWQILAVIPMQLQQISHIQFKNLKKIFLDVRRKTLSLQGISWINMPSIQAINLSSINITSLKPLSKTNFKNLDQLSFIKNKCLKTDQFNYLNRMMKIKNLINFNFDLQYKQKNIVFGQNSRAVTRGILINTLMKFPSNRIYNNRISKRYFSYLSRESKTAEKLMRVLKNKKMQLQLEY